jgi:hypothetical protein
MIYVGEEVMMLHQTDLALSAPPLGCVPIGPVLERGSNANGDFVRLANGTLLCRHQMVSNEKGVTRWTFPANFVAAPRVTGEPIATDLKLHFAVSNSEAAHFFDVWDASGKRTATHIILDAIGRWF